MSNFTYEIDERNLRLKMKEFTVPVKEEDWQKFETFSDTMISQSRENRMRFNFSLNRNVVLPSVFGVIIILFSFLLVNFVSIKNPVRAVDQKSEELPVMPMQEPKIEQTVPRAEKAKVETPAAVTETVADIKPEEKAMMTALVTEPEITNTPSIATSVETPSDIASQETEAKAKRREIRRAEALEAQKLLEIRPTPVSEERDAEEIRPD